MRQLRALCSPQRRSREQAFTLVELLIVVGIVLVLAAIAIPVYLGIQQQAKDSALEADVQRVVKQTLITTQQANAVTNANGYVAYQTGTANPAASGQVGVPYTVANSNSRIMITDPVPDGTNPVSGSVNGKYIKQTNGSPSGYEITGYFTDNSFYFTYNSDTGKFTTGDNPYYTEYAPSWSGGSVTSTLPAAIVGQAYAFTFTTKASPDATYTATGLPNGLTLSSDGKLTGTPTTGGPYTLNVTASNPSGNLTGNFSLLVQVPPTITTTSLPAASKDNPYSTTITATGIANPTFSATGLPTGLSIDPNSGIISGTPSVRGTFTPTITATNGAGNIAATFGLVVKDSPTIDSTNNLGTITVGTAYNYTVTATGEPAPTFTATGLPTGLSINNAGLISGTIDPSDPTYGTGGTYSITVTATNTSGSTSKTFTGNIYAPPVFTTTALAPATTGKAYTATVAATGTPAPTFTATGLPAGLSISASGAISGTPTTAGTYTVTVTATNAAGSVNNGYVIVVRTAPTITTTSLPVGKAGSLYQTTVTATGSPAPTFAATGLPSGLTIDANTGMISGTPTINGTFTVTVTATNPAGSDTQSFALKINAAPVITTTSLSSGVVGVAYSDSVAATGDPAPTFAATGLPPGLSLNATTGALTGTPTTTGTYTANITATNAAGSSTASFGIVINAVPSITTASLPSGVVGTTYSATVAATGTPAPTFSVSAGSLPGGLALTSASGAITGTPTTAGSYTFTIKATNSVGSDTQSYTLIVNQTPSITTTSLPSGVVGNAYSSTISATGSPAPTFSVSAGSLPTGLSLSSTGTVSGTPSATGTFSFTVTATNSVGTDTQSYAVVINKVPSISTTSLPGGKVGTSYSATVSASGSPAPTFSVSAGSLPSGLSLNGTSGVISGTPSAAGSYSFTIKASNGVGSDTQAFTVTITQSPTITTTSLATGKVGTAYSSDINASGSPAPTYSVTAGSLPSGLGLNGTSGTISGTPSASGSYNITVTATNSAGSDTQNYTLVVNQTPSITTSSIANFTDTASSYSTTINATGYPSPTFSMSGAPGGIGINSSNGVISGSPTDDKVFTITVTASNAAGSASQSYTTNSIANYVQKYHAGDTTGWTQASNTNYAPVTISASYDGSNSSIKMVTAQASSSNTCNLNGTSYTGLCGHAHYNMSDLTVGATYNVSACMSASTTSIARVGFTFGTSNTYSTSAISSTSEGNVWKCFNTTYTASATTDYVNFIGMNTSTTSEHEWTVSALSITRQ